ncbi:hypothetical protein ACIRBX_16175 [Kitasatospora sp. NPDC096147]|uniref:hypothetical protein n=1 Tax=Kitasatospora sp. NPDC096147 TaxID=3364093 RepID=UPI003815A66A
MAVLRSLLTAAFLPVQLCMLAFHYRMGRLRAARAAGDRGAISIELALAVVVLVGVAAAVIVAVNRLAGNVTNRVPHDQTVPAPAPAP